MSFWGSKSAKNKKQQIKTLLAKQNQGLQVSQIDSRTFRVTFRTRVSTQWIIISLSDDFPSSPPQLRTDSKFSHTLIDNNGFIVGLSDLIKWNSYSELGNVVQKCVHSFVAQPPSIKQEPNLQQMYQQQISNQQQPGYGSQQYINKQPPSYDQHIHNNNNNNNNNSINNNNNNNNNINNNEMKHNKSEESEFDIGLMTLSVNNELIKESLNKLNKKELNDLNKEDKLLIEFSYRISSTIRELRRDTQNAVLKLAQSNLDKQKELSKEKNEIDEIRSEIDTLTELYTNLKNRQNKVLSKYSAQRINKEFEDAIDKTDQECEALRDKFDEKDIPAVTFVKKYTKEKQAHHLLKIKQEKYNKQYNKQYK